MKTASKTAPRARKIIAAVKLDERALAQVSGGGGGPPQISYTLNTGIIYTLNTGVRS